MSFAFNFEKSPKKATLVPQSKLSSTQTTAAATYASAPHSVVAPEISPEQLVFRLKEEGNSLAEAGHFVRALSKWEEALQIEPHNGVLHELRAQVLMEMGEYEFARDAALLAVENAPLWSDAHFALGRAHFNLGELEEARICMSRALQLAVEHVDAHGRAVEAFLSPSEIEDELDEVLHLLELKQQRLDSQVEHASQSLQETSPAEEETPENNHFE